MQKHQLGSFQPYFHIREIKYGEKVQNVLITSTIISGMTDRGFFDVGSIVIPVTEQTGIISINLHLTDDKSNSQPNGLPISGFPRSLADVDPLKRACEHNSYQMPETQSLIYFFLQHHPSQNTNPVDKFSALLHAH